LTLIGRVIRPGMDLKSCKKFMPRTRILDHVQTAVDAQHHLIVAHDVTNCRPRPRSTREHGGSGQAMGVEALDVLADRMCATHFKTRALEKVRTEMSLHVCAPEAAPQKLMLLSKSVEIRQSETASRPIIRVK
jgi:hypothetical protein